MVNKKDFNFIHYIWKGKNCIKWVLESQKLKQQILPSNLLLFTVLLLPMIWQVSFRGEYEDITLSASSSVWFVFIVKYRHLDEKYIKSALA